MGNPQFESIVEYGSDSYEMSDQVRDVTQHSVRIEKAEFNSIEKAFKRLLSIGNTTDQQLTITAYAYDTKNPKKEAGSNLSIVSTTINAGLTHYFTETNISWFNEPWNGILVYYSFATAPTIGEVWIGMRSLG